MIRLLALITMLIDHIGAVFFSEYIIFRIIGRLAFPLFAWGIARGYRYTRSFKKYALRLLLLGIISQYPYMLLFDTYGINICITLLASLVALKLYDNKNKFVRVVSLASLFAAILVLEFVFNIELEYSLYGVLTVLGFHIFWQDRLLIIYQALLTLIATPALNYHTIQLYSIFSSPLVLQLEKKNFRLNRVLQYGFYPIHIIILLVIKQLYF